MLVLFGFVFGVERVIMEVKGGSRGRFCFWIDELQHFFIGFSLNGAFDEMGIDGLSALEFLVELDELMRFVVELDCFVLGRESVLDESSRYV